MSSGRPSYTQKLQSQDVVLLNKPFQLIRELKYEEALNIFIALSKKYPNDMSIKLGIARCHQGKGSYNAAIDIILDILAKSSSQEILMNEVNIYLALAGLYRALKMIDQYRSALMKIRDQKHPKVLLAWVSYYYFASEFQSCMDKIKEIEMFYYDSLTDKNRETLVLCKARLTGTLSLENLLVEIKKELQSKKIRVLSLQERLKDLSILIVNLPVKERDHPIKLAKEIFQQIKINRPDFDSIDTEMFFYTMLEQVREAESLYETLLQSKDQKHLDAFCDYAIFIGKSAIGNQAKKQSIEILSEQVIKPIQAKISAAAKRNEAVHFHYNELLSKAHHSMAITYLDLGKPKASFEHVKEAIRASSIFAPAWSFLGKYLRDIGNYDYGHKCLEHARKLNAYRFKRLHGLKSDDNALIQLDKEKSQQMHASEILFCEIIDFYKSDDFSLGRILEWESKVTLAKEAATKGDYLMSNKELNILLDEIHKLPTKEHTILIKRFQAKIHTHLADNLHKLGKVEEAFSLANRAVLIDERQVDAWRILLNHYVKYDNLFKASECEERLKKFAKEEVVFESPSNDNNNIQENNEVEDSASFLQELIAQEEHSFDLQAQNESSYDNHINEETGENENAQNNAPKHKKRPKKKKVQNKFEETIEADDNKPEEHWFCEPYLPEPVNHAIKQITSIGYGLFSQAYKMAYGATPLEEISEEKSSLPKSKHS